MRPVHEAKVDLGTGSQNMGLSGHCRCGAQRCKHCAAVYCAREWNADKEKADRLIGRSAAGRPMVLPGVRDAEHFFRAFLQKLRESPINNAGKAASCPAFCLWQMRTCPDFLTAKSQHNSANRLTAPPVSLFVCLPPSPLLTDAPALFQPNFK